MPVVGNPSPWKRHSPRLVNEVTLRVTLLTALCGALFCPPVFAQVLRSAENTPEQAEIKPQLTPELVETVKRMQTLLAELQSGGLTPEQQQAALQQLIDDNAVILSQHSTWVDWQKPQTADSVALLLERMVFEEAAELAPTEESREQVLRNSPEHLDLEPGSPQAVPRYEPPLLAPQLEETSKPAAGSETSISDSPQQAPAILTTPAAQDEGALAGAPAQATEPVTNTKKDSVDVPGLPVKASVLADTEVTTEMHEDNAILRDVTNAQGELVLFGRLRLWAGGAVQLDTYSAKDLFTFGQGGDTDSDAYIRRAEGVLRASVFENGEVKIQYDFEAGTFKNLYWRWLSNANSSSTTVGNQKEPMGMDYQVGNKFATAMETSAPTSTFGSYRSTGVRYNNWDTLASDDNPTKWWGDSSTYVTSSIGVFGRDIEDTNGTDWAVTGRVTVGGLVSASGGFHLGASGSYRHGDFNRIAPRPGLHDVNKIPLATQDADTLAVVGLEAMFVSGSLHAQLESYYGDYSGGEADADGWGSYGQVGWLFGGKRRPYQPRYGTWGPINASKEQVVEVFARISNTRGNDENNSSNELRLLTVGGNWYYHQFRVSSNLLYADTKRNVMEQSDGFALALRFQYLF